jgi:hypothetical protein
MCGFSKREPGIPPGIGCQVPGTRCRVPATWHLVPDTRYRINAEGRTPSTEDRAKRAHRVCTMQDRKGADPGYLVPGTWYLAPVPNSHTSNLNKALLLR